MALSDNRRLFDIASRLTVYVEDVKIEQAKAFDKVLFEVNKLLKKLLFRVNYKTLDGLSKSQLNKLILELREGQTKIYSNYSNKLIEQLKEFMSVDLEVNRRVWVTSLVETDNETQSKIVSDKEAIAYITENSRNKSKSLFGVSAIIGNESKLWSYATNLPLPANGLYLVPFIKTFTISAQAGVENIIRKAWSNKLTIGETLDALIGKEGIIDNEPYQLSKLRNQANSVVHTSFSHISTIGTAGVMSSLFKQYIWNSIIDGRTTEICISRNKKIYTFGKGPLPPAHIHCRSGISPFVLGSFIPEETFYVWISKQAKGFQDDVLGTKQAALLRNGKLKAQDLGKYRTYKPLTFEQYRNKIVEILNR